MLIITLISFLRVEDIHWLRCQLHGRTSTTAVTSLTTRMIAEWLNETAKTRGRCPTLTGEGNGPERKLGHEVHSPIKGVELVRPLPKESFKKSIEWKRLVTQEGQELQYLRKEIEMDYLLLQRPHAVKKLKDKLLGLELVVNYSYSSSLQLSLDGSECNTILGVRFRLEH
jgi:hypothetical protein